MKTIENRLEGNGASRLLQLFGGKYIGGLEMTVATVSSASPIAIRIAGDTFDITGDALIVAESISGYRRTVSISGGADVEMNVRNSLKTGDKVIVVIAQDGQLYYVMDKAV